MTISPAPVVDPIGPLSHDIDPFHQISILGSKFNVKSRYRELKPLGCGISGLVCSAKDRVSQQRVAVKKLSEPLRSNVVARRMLREIKLLKQLRHENVVCLRDIFMSPSQDIYLVTDLMTTDLGRVLRETKLEEHFTQFFIYQIMRGLKYIHSSGVVHRDLKPSNILINEECEVRICDFGLARVQGESMTGYIATRYYRAPEVMLSWRQYHEKVDIWSAGCILAEMLSGTVLFPGRNHVDQFSEITKVLGQPRDEVLAGISSQRALDFIHSLPTRARVPLSHVMPKASEKAISLLEDILQYDPKQRISAHQALNSPYLAPYHQSEDECAADGLFDCLYEVELPLTVWRAMMSAEILNFQEQTCVGAKLRPSSTSCPAFDLA